MLNSIEISFYFIINIINMEDTVNQPAHSRIVKLFQKTDRPFRVEWLFLLLIALFFVISYSYGDIIITTRHSIRLWDCLFDGHFFDFYHYNVNAATENSVFTTPQSAAYDFTIYLIFAIWNFPLWVVEKLFQIPVTENFFCLIWPKLLLVLSAFFAAKSLKRIVTVLDLGEKAANWVPFIWCSSVLVCSSMLMISQYDIISLLFILLGFEAYLKADTKKFILFFALATSCKYFALLIFLPLVLLRWKKIWQIIALTVSSFALTLFWKALFLLASQSIVEPSIVGSLLNTISTNTLDVGLYSAALFFIAFIATCIFAYSRNDEPELQKLNALYVSTASMIGFIALTQIYPYWCILATPFLVLICFANRERLKLNLFLEMGLGLSIVFQQMFYYSFCYSNYLLAPMLWGKLLGSNVDLTEGIGTVFYHINLSIPLMNGLSALMICGAAALMIFNTPNKLLRSQQCDCTIERSVIWFRIFLFALVGLLPIASYIHQLL